MSYLPQTRPAVNALQMLCSVSSSKLHHTSGQWCIVTSNFLLFNIIIMYCLSHNLLCFFAQLTLSTKKTHHKHLHHLYMPCICRHSITQLQLIWYRVVSMSTTASLTQRTQHRGMATTTSTTELRCLFCRETTAQKENRCRMTFNKLFLENCHHAEAEAIVFFVVRV